MITRKFAFNCVYGTGTPATAYAVEIESGGFWYAVEDSVNVNFTFDILTDSIDVETVNDIDMFTAPSPITDEFDLAEAVES